ncbi:helix-turn-helix transcriptional regulator [Alistipes finegoldii]|jgi:transcriptional regulator with XRE-family HTH domain|uniref:helix-turn-helix domain-containing protein n=1 Tax=Alistipes finegoldii TaxID=214856 RepID=UPI002593E066|nr:helix-turn-helix transcriptional regulator [Alistipes finegoldii]
MKADKLFNECLANVPNDITIEIDLSFDIATKIDTILSNRKISQKDFAAMIGKKESEVSKWLKGTHNFTLRTIAKITDVLNEPIIEVAGKRIPNNEYIFINVIDSFIVSKKSKPIAIQDKSDYIPITWSNHSWDMANNMIN